MSRSLLRSALTVTTLGVLTRGLSFLFRIYLSRKIGAESLGIYQISLSVFFLFATLSSGLPLTLSRKTAEMHAIGKNSGEKSLISATLLIGLIVSGGVVVIFYLLSQNLTFLFSDTRCIPLFLILLPSCISTAIYGIVRGWFWGRKRYEVFALTEFFECVVRILLGVLFISGIINGIDGATGTALSFTLSDYLCTIAIIGLFFIFGGRLNKPYGYKKIVKTALPLTAVRLYNSLINSLVAIIVPAMLISSGATQSEAMIDYGRVMGMALPLILSPSMLTGALNTVLVPEIASLKARGDNENLARKTLGSLGIAVFCALAFLSIFIPLGEKIGILFYEDKIAGSYVSNSAIIMVSIVLNGVTSTIMDSLGLEVKTMKNFIIGSLFLVISLLALPKFVGVYSIVIGFGLSYSVTTILNLVEIKKCLNLSFKSFISSLFVQSLVASLTVFGVTFIKNLTNSLPLVLSITIPSIFGLLFFTISNVALGQIDVSGFLAKKKKVGKPT